MLNRTGMAFTFSFEKLAARYRKLYFWTFTFLQTPLDDQIAMEDYHIFMNRIVKTWPGIEGLRVSELHESHGIHFHCVLNMRIPIKRVMRLAKGNGLLVGRNRWLPFGRMSVERCNNDIVNYLAPYLTKQYRDRFSFGRRRRWGAIGGFDVTRNKDLVYTSTVSENKEKMRITGMRLPFKVNQLTTQLSNIWGDYETWPKEIQTFYWRNFERERGIAFNLGRSVPRSQETVALGVNVA